MHSGCRVSFVMGALGSVNPIQPIERRLPRGPPGLKIQPAVSKEMKDNLDHRTKHSAALVKLAKVMGPIRTEGLTENVVRQLKDCVRRRIITPGERLPPERELAALLKISRGSLRQALKALQVMGVLNVVQGSGAYLAD